MTADFRQRMMAINPQLKDFNYGPESYDAAIVIALAAQIATDDGSAHAGEIVGVTTEGEKCTVYADCLELVRQFPAAGVARAETRAKNWAQFREAAGFARCIGVLRFDQDRLVRGPRMFFDWLAEQDPDVLIWDLAISYASEDEPLARQIHAQLRD